MSGNKFYVVRKGRVPGIYRTWDEAKLQVDGFQGAVYKSFSSLNDAQSFLQDNDIEVKVPEFNKCFDLPDNAYAFVDGSYNPATGVSGYGGFLMSSPDSNGCRKRYVLQGKSDDMEFCKQRNVAGELLGTLAALKQASNIGCDKLTIFYDYEGIRSWVTGDWKANNSYTQRYAERVRQYKELAGIDIEFVHTKGHSGIEGNEIADRLAKDAVGVSVKRPVFDDECCSDNICDFECS